MIIDDTETHAEELEALASSSRSTAPPLVTPLSRYRRWRWLSFVPLDWLGFEQGSPLEALRVGTFWLAVSGRTRRPFHLASDHQLVSFTLISPWFVSQRCWHS